MIKFQRHAKELLEMYDRFVDSEGKTTLNQEEYKQYRLAMAEKKKKETKVKQAKKNKMQMK